MATPIITDGTMDRLAEAPRVVLPAVDLYAERAARFSQLAAGHPMGDYLRLMALVSRAQAAALPLRRAAALGDELVARSRDFGMPPLAAQTHARAAQWRDDLATIASHVRAAAGAEVKAALDRLVALDAAALEGLADRVLLGTADDVDAASVPFVGAALQVYFSRAAAALDPEVLAAADVPTICPACAMRPVASVVRIGGARNGSRYLVCSLCGTEWHLARIKCSACEEEKGVHYLALQAAEGPQSSAGAVRAEACDECKSYLKIVFQDKDPNVDPAADDLATLGLDVLVDEQGFGRSGPNLLFHPGSG